MKGFQKRLLACVASGELTAGAAGVVLRLVAECRDAQRAERRAKRHSRNGTREGLTAAVEALRHGRF